MANKDREIFQLEKALETFIEDDFADNRECFDSAIKRSKELLKNLEKIRNSKDLEKFQEEFLQIQESFHKIFKSSQTLNESLQQLRKTVTI